MAELAAGPRHARYAISFLQRDGVQGLLGSTWSTRHWKYTAGGSITVTVLSRA